MKIKIFITLVSLYFAVSMAFLSTGCDESSTTPDTLTADTTIDSNVLEFFNRVIHEWNGNDNSLSAMNLLSGTVVNEHDANKDIQMRDSNGTRFNFFLRSGDQAIRIPGSRTLFGQFIAYADMTASEFDTLSQITNLGSTLEPSDFYRVSTAEYTNPTYFNAPLTQNTVYSFFLVDKSTTSNIFGMIRLRSAVIQSNEFLLAVDVKLNTAGQNQFRRMTITQP
jgi:hypothetical protein